MNRIALGAILALVLTGVGLFWWQGRAEVERGAPLPLPLDASRLEPRRAKGGGSRNTGFSAEGRADQGGPRIRLQHFRTDGRSHSSPSCIWKYSQRRGVSVSSARLA